MQSAILQLKFHFFEIMKNKIHRLNCHKTLWACLVLYYKHKSYVLNHVNHWKLNKPINFFTVTRKKRLRCRWVDDPGQTPNLPLAWFDKAQEKLSFGPATGFSTNQWAFECRKTRSTTSYHDTLFWETRKYTSFG